MFFKRKLNKIDKTVNLEFGGNNEHLGKFAFVLKIEDVDNELKIIF